MTPLKIDSFFLNQLIVKTKVRKDVQKLSKFLCAQCRGNFPLLFAKMTNRFTLYLCRFPQARSDPVLPPHEIVKFDEKISWRYGGGWGEKAGGGKI